VFFQTMDVGKVLKRKLPRIGGCFATALDGCFGSEDAALREPYKNNPSSKGILYYPQEQIDAFCIRVNRAELQIEMHAIGDAAFDQAVKGIESALKDYPRTDHRHTIIHACLPAMKGLEKCASLGIGIAAQSAFLNWNLEPDEYVESLLGARTKKILPLRTMRKLGIHVSFGSDAPCTIPDPVTWIYNACNHPVASESVSVADALRMATYEAAWTGFDDRDRGSLAEGKIADMVIMNENPLAVPVKKLMRLKVEKLILSGKPYKSGQGLGELAVKFCLKSLFPAL